MVSLCNWLEREARKRRMLFPCFDKVEETKRRRHKRRSETELEDEEYEEEEEEEDEDETEAEEEEDEQDDEEKDKGSFLFANVRQLLWTGLFEGASVTYKNSFHNVELQGFIKGDKYLCGCSMCKYNKALSATMFEKHAGTTSSHANNHIFLRNGKPLHEVVKQLNSASDSSLYKEMQNAIGCTINRDIFEAWRRSEAIKYSSEMNGRLLQEKCATRYEASLSNMKEPISTQSVISHLNIDALHDAEEGEHFNSEDYEANQFQVQERETLVDASRTERFIDSKSKQMEKRISIDMKGSNISNVKALLSTGLLEGFPVTYKKGEIEIPGIIRDLGYLCGCSSCGYTKVLSALEFEKHARVATKNQNDHVFLDNGISLYKLVKELQAKCIEPTAENIAEFTGCRPNIKCLEKGEGINTNAKKIQDDRLDFAVRRSEIDAEGSPETFDTQLNFLQQSNGERTRQSITADSKNCYSGTEVRSCAKIATVNPIGSWGVRKAISFTSSLSRNLSTIQLIKEGDMQPSSLDARKGSHERIVAQQSNILKKGDDIEIQQSSGLILIPRSQGAQDSTSCAHISTVEANSLPSAEEIRHEISSLTEDIYAIKLSQESDMSCMFLGSKREESVSTVCNFILSESSSDPPTENGTLAASNDQICILPSNNADNSSFMMQSGVNKDPDPNLNTNENQISQAPLLKQTVYPAIMNCDSSCKQLSNVSTSSSQAETNKYSNKIPTVSALQGSAFFPKLNDIYGQSKVTTDSHSRNRVHNLHQFIFKDNGLPDGSQMFYCMKGEVLKTGQKIGNSIKCDCCEQQMCPSQFEAHAGHSKKRQPYHNIYTSDGKSLHDVSISLSRRENSLLSSTTVYFDGRCQGCSELPYIPDNQLSFTDCEDHFWSRDSTQIKRGGISGYSKLLVNRQLQVQTVEHLCCTLCDDTGYSLDIFNEKTEIFCLQCEREYHIGCLKTHKICDLKEVPADCIWFCSRECNLIFFALHKLVISGEQFGEEPGDSSLLRVIKIKALKRSSTKIFEAESDMQWQILSRKHSAKQLLSQANEIFQDAFAPILGRGYNLIPYMICGEDAGGRLFEGMHCAVITVKSSIVSAGIFRIFGQRVAELPLITTLWKYQRKGYFKLLLLMIEELLFYLNIESLLVAADESEESLWIEKHGFAKLTDERLLAYLRDYPLLMFQNTTMLEKTIKHPFIR